MWVFYSFFEEMPDLDAQEEMLNGLEQLRRKLDAGEIIKKAEYVD